MRIQILSDLHLEFDPDHGESFARQVPVAGDVLVLAGDVLSLQSMRGAERTFRWFCERFEDVVFVPGNHEYYLIDPTEAAAVLKSCSRTFENLHVLNPGEVTVHGTRFVGGTLWFPPTPDEERFRGYLSDFEVIREFVPWVHETHARHLAFIEENVKPGDVVVTHHLPHRRSVAPQYQDSPLNRFFLAEDAERLVEELGASVWIHGHTHDACDYVVGRTRVVGNPRGYPGEVKRPYDPAFCVEV